MKQFQVSYISAMGKMGCISFKAPNSAAAMIVAREACNQLSVRYGALVRV